MASPPHILLFPFMAKCHVTPLLHLARLLLHHGAAVTVLTTPANRPFISSSSSAAISVVDIPFPQNIRGIPPDVESADELPDISMWVPFAAATKLMQPHFDQILQSLLPPLSFVVSDDFLSWTLDSAVKHGVPRFVFYALGTFSLSITLTVARRRFHDVNGGDLLKVKAADHFPWIEIKREEIDPDLFIDPKFVGTDYYNYAYDNIESSSRSHGIVMNSFYDFESVYVMKWKSTFGPKMWCLGPFCLPAEKNRWPENHPKAACIRWLDEMVERGERVLYVALGTQIEISPEQFEEIKTGLEKSGVNFLWVVRNNESQLEDKFEERVRERGIVVREWVDEREILEHGGVEGFLSQCGWTSVMESICAKVPILALPAMWHHPLNAVLEAEELRVGLRVEGGCDGFVRWRSLAAAAKELMEGEMGEEVRRNATELGGAAVRAVEEGGSSWLSMKELLSEFGQTRK